MFVCVYLLIKQLLNRNPDRRLGMPNCSSGDVTVQPFFNGINWQHADLKQLKPPFKPDLVSLRLRLPLFELVYLNFLCFLMKQKSADDISNFDKEFTEAEPALTPIDENITSTLDHQLFDGFSYTNPNMTD